MNIEIERRLLDIAANAPPDIARQLCSLAHDAAKLERGVRFSKAPTARVWMFERQLAGQAPLVDRHGKIGYSREVAPGLVPAIVSAISLLKG